MSQYQQVMDALRREPRRWLVTGAAGFIGSHLVERLLELDQVVVGMDNFATGHARNLEDVGRRVGRLAARRLRFLEGDLRTLQDCRRTCDGVDVVLHHAALGSVPQSVDDPALNGAVNAGGTLNLLSAAREA